MYHDAQDGGKGDRPRRPTNQAHYNSEYDRIFGCRDLFSELDSEPSRDTDSVGDSDTESQ